MGGEGRVAKRKYSFATFAGSLGLLFRELGLKK